MEITARLCIALPNERNPLSHNPNDRKNSLVLRKKHMFIKNTSEMEMASPNPSQPTSASFAAQT